MNVDWSYVGMVLTTGHHFSIYTGTLPGDLICDRCAWVIQAGDPVALDDICPGENA